MYVLIVDDEADIRTLVSAFLAREGIKSRCCETVKDANTWLQKERFDYHLLDVHLPDGSGIELAKHIYGQRQAANILLMSAYDDALDEIDLEAFPINQFLKKPFTNKQLLAALQTQ